MRPRRTAPPVDPDLPGPARPVHLQARHLLLVALGGTLGTAARGALTLAAPGPWPVVAINVTGALLLGLLLEALARRGPDEGVRRDLRLLLGTGALGGFTTYSTFAAGAVGLASADPGRALGVVAATLVLGTLAAAAGVAVGSAAHRGGRR